MAGCRLLLAGGLWRKDLRDKGSSFKEIAFESADPPESQARITGSTSVNQEPSSPRRMGEPSTGRQERREYFGSNQASHRIHSHRGTGWGRSSVGPALGWHQQPAENIGNKPAGQVGAQHVNTAYCARRCALTIYGADFILTTTLLRLREMKSLP